MDNDRQHGADLAEALPQLVWSCRADGQCDYLSPQWVAYTGVPARDQLGQGWTAQVHPDDLPAILSCWQDAVRDGTPYDVELRVRRHDGAFRWFKTRGVPLRGGGIGIDGWLGTCTDIHEMREARAALQEERDRLAAIAAIAPSIVHTFRMDPAGNFSFPFGSERLADEVYGLPADELRHDANALVQRLHPDDARRVNDSVMQSRRDGTPWRCEFRVLHPARGELWIEAHSSPVREADGGMLWHGALTDITERKRADQALFESRAQLETVFDNLSEGLVMCQLDTMLSNWNRAALAMHGFASVEEARMPLAELAGWFSLNRLDGTPVPLGDWPLARILRGHTLHDEEVVVHSLQHGWKKVFNYNGAIVDNAAGKPMLAVVMVNDITQRKCGEAQLQRLNAELEDRVHARTAELQAAVKELEAFSYSISHDLRAPLRAIDGFSQALSQDCAALLPDTGQRYLRIIRESAQKMAQLIDDLLAFSRLSRQPLTRRPVDNALLLRDAFTVLAPMRDGRQIELRIGELPPCDGDPALLRQVWINLLSNALKYTRQRERTLIEIGIQPGQAAGDAPEYFVRDNGTGFDMRYAHKLFGVFERLHRAEEFEGTGVGLAIVQRIVQRHGGTIRAFAEPGAGATFLFSIAPGASS